jgi:hypothetical protein
MSQNYNVGIKLGASEILSKANEFLDTLNPPQKDLTPDNEHVYSLLII